jgi:site-specific DNA recombinase
VTTTSSQTLRAGLYTRVSADKSGVGRSPAEQEAQGRQDCEREGWQVDEVYCDNDRGASRYSKGKRPDLARLKADVAAGKLDVLVAWEASRFQRDLAAYSELADLCRRHDVRWSYNGRLFDLDDADDEFQTGFDALLAQREAAVTRKRVKRALAANASAGRVHGKVQFGYRRIYDPHSKALVGQEVDPVTGPVVTEVFRRVAEGESLRSLAAELNERGVPTPTGVDWSGALVGHLLKRESYLGRRTHHGTVTAEGAWPALVDESTWHAVHAARAALTPSVVGNATARHLLSGIVHCGVCGSRVAYDPRSGRPGQNPLYACYAKKCVSRTASVAEDVVERLVIARLSRPDDALTTGDLADTSQEVATAIEEARVLRERLAALEEDVVAGRLSGEAFGRMEAKIAEGIAAADDRARAAVAVDLPDVVRALTGEDVAARWAELPLEDRRTVVRTLLVDPVFVRKRGNADVPPDGLGLAFRWVGSDERQVI